MTHRYDFNRRPETWSDEDGDMVWVEVTEQTADLDAALAWLIGHDSLDLFDSLLYEAGPDAEIDPASIYCRGVDVSLPPMRLAGSFSRFKSGVVSTPVSLPEMVWTDRLVRSGEATATWRFDISAAAIKGANAHAA